MLNKLKEKVNNIAEINDEALFEPRAIVKMELVVDTLMKPSVFTIYRLIKRGKLPAIDLSTGTAPRYFVRGKDLKEFLSKRYDTVKIKEVKIKVKKIKN